jgi:hypothetical protein
MEEIIKIGFPINPVEVGLPVRTATQLLWRTGAFQFGSVTCMTYYELLTDSNEVVISGNYELTEEQFENWGQDNAYIGDIILEYLNLTRI